MSSKTKIVPVSLLKKKSFKNNKNLNKIKPTKQTVSNMSLDKLRKSKRFRELGDMLYLD